MSEFTSRGYADVPELYNDRVHRKQFISSLGDEALQAMVEKYSQFLDSDPMPHHEAQATHYLRHLTFEQDWRSGVFQQD